MSAVSQPTATLSVRTLRFFERFTLGQRWEHVLLLVSFVALALTGLVQKYRTEPISQQILATPEALLTIRNIHHFFAVILTLEALYHLARAIYLLAKRRMPSAMFPTWRDVKDAGQMIKYLVYLTHQKPRFGKYNFEQKFTYWFLFFGIGIMTLTGFIIWFPIQITSVVSGGVVPAAKLAHSTESVVAVAFVLIWHGYHVLVERLNLSMFTGRLNEADMREHHTSEYERLTGQSVEAAPANRGGQA